MCLRYLKGAFVLDFLGSLSAVLWSNTAFKLFRLLRLLKLNHVLSRYQNAPTFRIIRLFGIILLICHWVGCAWYAIGVASHEGRPPLGLGRTTVPLCVDVFGHADETRDCSWLTSNGFFQRASTNAPWTTGLSVTSLYARSMYWAVTTLSTVG